MSECKLYDQYRGYNMSQFSLYILCDIMQKHLNYVIKLTFKTGVNIVANNLYWTDDG